MAIVSCPECGKKLKVADASMGKKVKGPCGHVFVAQGEGEVAAAPKPAAPPAVAPEKVYVACTECGAKLKVATTSLGKRMKCPKCTAVFVASLPEEEAPAPKPAAKPAVSDADMDDLLAFAQTEAANGEANGDDSDLFKNEPVKSRAQRKMDEDGEAGDDDEPRPKGKGKPRRGDDDDEDEPLPKGKKPTKPPRFGQGDEEPARPVYPSRLIPNLLVTLLILAFGGLVGAIFFEVNIAKQIGIPETKIRTRPILHKTDEGPAKGNKQSDPKQDDLNKKEAAALNGRWIVASADSAAGPLEDLVEKKFVFADGQVTSPDGKTAAFTLDAAHTPKWINLPASVVGIYQLDGDTLKLCYVFPEKGVTKSGKEFKKAGVRPKKFDAAEGTLLVLNREKKADNGAEPDLKKDQKKSETDVSKGKPSEDDPLDGAWIIESALVKGKEDSSKNGEVVVFADGKLTGLGPVAAPFKAVGKENSGIIDIALPEPGNPTLLGVFKAENDKLRLALSQGKERPTGIDDKSAVVVTLRRAPKGQPLYSRASSEINLKMIGLAVHSYHDAFKRMPPVALSGDKDPEAKPLLSWRVALLPYLDQLELYQKFDLNQPWDHPTNKALIPKMPKVFAAHIHGGKEGMTHYRAFTGPGTPLEPEKGPDGKLCGKWTFAAMTDGISNTFMVVEAADPTIWTKPDEMPLDPKGPLPKLGVVPEGFHALRCDAVPLFLSPKNTDKLLRPFFTCNNGMPRGELELAPAKVLPAEKKMARTQAAQVLTTAAKAWFINNQEWPQALADLLGKDNAGKGPYIENKNALLDPWGKPYQYDPAGKRNGGLQPDIWTVAPDGEIIGNWPAAKPDKKDSEEK